MSRNVQRSAIALSRLNWAKGFSAIRRLLAREGSDAWWYAVLSATDNAAMPARFHDERQPGKMKAADLAENAPRGRHSQ